MILGSHLSIAGGLEKALQAADGYGFNAVAMFLRNQRQWQAGPLLPEKVEIFRKTREETGIEVVVAHGSYLVNLAGEKHIRDKSIRAVTEDITRCGLLEIEYLVLHPGSCPDPAEGIARIVDGLNQAVAACEFPDPMILLETTAGQGNCIGHRFEQLGDILSRVDSPERFGICLDTAHVFAAGYDFRTKSQFQKMIKNFDEAIGLENLRAIHLNDSKTTFGSRADRHEHIGAGKIGLDGFRWFLKSRKLRDVPIILETPKGVTETGEDWDEINSKTLRDLAVD